MISHTVPLSVFDRLAEGGGDTTGVLQAGRRSKRLLLLHDVVTTALVQAPAACAEARTAEAYALLTEAHRRARPVVDQVLLQPHVGAWATACLRRLVNGDELPPHDLGHLGAIAGAAALKAGTAFEVTAAGRAGWLMLPTFGMVRSPVGDRWCRVRSRTAATGIEVSDGGSWSTILLSAPGSATWRPLRRLRSSAGGMTLDVALDDIDPYRACGPLPVADRLDDGTVATWQEKLDEAWSLLVTDHPHHAEAIAAGIVAVVPLRPSEGAEELSATCHEAGGAIATTPPHRALTLALALVHEFQHTKLSALLDLIPLHEPAREKDLYAPWRADPRPLAGLLQGTYAFLGLAGFWEVRRRHRGPSELAAAEDWAQFEFALARSQVKQALDTLRRSRHLLPMGRRFVEGMARRLARLARLAIAPRVRSLVDLALHDHRTSWRLRNLRPHGGQLASLTDAWVRGRRCPWPDQLSTDPVDGRGPVPSAARSALLRQHLAFPTRWRDDIGTASPADVHLIDGDLDRARSLYDRQLAENPDDLASWSGLALVHRERPTAATRALAQFPEWVRALHESIRQRSDVGPHPDDLAAWIAGA